MREPSRAVLVSTALTALISITACATTPPITPSQTIKAPTTTSGATSPQLTLEQVKIRNPRKTTSADICSVITQEIVNRITRSAHEQQANNTEQGASCSWQGRDANISVNAGTKLSIVDSSRDPLAQPGEIVEIYGNTAWQHKRGRTQKEGCSASVAVDSTGKTLYVMVDTFGFEPLPDTCATVRELAETTLAALPKN